MQRDENDIALSVWAVTCDALARGEQIFLLVPGAAEAIRDLRHEEFWLLPDWRRHDLQALTEPYQDRMRALDELRHQDGRVRVKYYATAEYAETFASHHDLRGLDGEHTLNARAVAELRDRGRRRDAGGRASGGALSLVVLRVHARAEASLVAWTDLERTRATRPSEAGATPGLDGADVEGDARAPARPLDRRWRRLPEPVSTADSEPVVDDERFISLKARLLQRTGAIRAV